MKRVWCKLWTVWGTMAVLCLTGCQTGSAKLVAPENGTAVHLMRPDWREQLAKRYEAADQKKGIHPDNLAFPRPVYFSWKNAEKLPCTLEIAHDDTFEHIVKSQDAGCGNSAEIFNLETGRKYFWRVKFPATTVSEVRSFRTAEGEPRLINIPGENPGPINIRDIGGKHRIGGGRTKQGMVYRGTELEYTYKMSESGRKVLRDELNIRTELDFRYPQHVKGRTGSELGSDVRWIHYAINAYDSFTPEQNGLFRDSIRVFANPDNYPIYCHCSGGVDRTGEIAFLIEAILDVEPEEMFLDYELSSLSIFPRHRDIPYFAHWRKQVAGFANPEDSWRTKVEKYLLAIGVTPEEIAAIRQNLIEQ